MSTNFNQYLALDTYFSILPPCLAYSIIQLIKIEL